MVNEGFESVSGAGICGSRFVRSVHQVDLDTEGDASRERTPAVCPAVLDGLYSMLIATLGHS